MRNLPDRTPALSAAPAARKAWQRSAAACAIATMACLLVATAQAQPLSIYVEGGNSFKDSGSAGTDSRTVGLQWRMHQSFWNGRIAGHWDLYLSDWKINGTAPGAPTHVTQIGLVPMFRHHFHGGRSPWFVEGGIGLSYLSTPYRTASKEFSTQWNFSTHLGLGRSFGTQRQHSVGISLKHESNAGLRHPNPGESFVQMRYSYRF